MKYRRESFLSPARRAGLGCKPESASRHTRLVSIAKSLGSGRADFATT
jgi:hypothetical protein